jgi:hypothetical protein
MKIGAVVLLGVSLILISGAILAYKSLIGSGDGQSTYVDYVVFFCLALGGAGVLILLFGFLQWFTKWGPEHGIMVKRSKPHS